jgi:hypothetical protein
MATLQKQLLCTLKRPYKRSFLIQTALTILNFTENSVKMTKTDYDPDRSLVLIEGLSHFLTNFLQNLASCQTN